MMQRSAGPLCALLLLLFNAAREGARIRASRVAGRPAGCGRPAAAPAAAVAMRCNPSEWRRYTSFAAATPPRRRRC